MKSLGWLTGYALALACADEGKSVAGESDTKMQGTVAASRPRRIEATPLDDGIATDNRYPGIADTIVQYDPRRTLGKILSRGLRTEMTK
jgi:hypothetical protein